MKGLLTASLQVFYERIDRHGGFVSFYSLPASQPAEPHSIPFGVRTQTGNGLCWVSSIIERTGAELKGQYGFTGPTIDRSEQTPAPFALIERLERETWQPVFSVNRKRQITYGELSPEEAVAARPLALCQQWVKQKEILALRNSRFVIVVLTFPNIALIPVGQPVPKGSTPIAVCDRYFKPIVTLTRQFDLYELGDQMAMALNPNIRAHREAKR